MDTIMFERSRIEELTTLEKALEVYHKEKFLAVKKELLGPEFDEETQTKIWEDYHDLMYKAASSGFEKGDYERLEFYRKLPGYWGMVSDETRLYFLTEITRNESGQIIKVTLNTLDNEVTKRWFEHIYNILIGRELVRVCAAEDCPNLFLKNRKNRKFCSESCRNQDWRKKHR
jgi:hypothetical protein